MNTLNREKQLAIIRALVEGNSVRSVERMTGVHRDTILRLLKRVGAHCEKLMEQRLQGFHSKHLQADEIWTFVGKKQKRLMGEEKHNPELGDQYVFVALDADTKLVPTFRVGKRDGHTASEFMADLRRRLNGNGRVQITTDGLNHYIDAVEQAFGSDVDYAQQVKLFAEIDPGFGRYSPPRVTEVVSTVFTGDPDPERISTSHVERQNLTMRMCMRRFTRLTNAFSKNLENLKAAVALHFAWYNFCRIHRSLRITPAMAAGVEAKVLDLSVLLPT